MVAFTYVISAPTASATLPGSVHGVVVHAMKNVPGSSVSSNFTYTEMSLTSLYPCATSDAASVVSQRGHTCIALYPS